MTQLLPAEADPTDEHHMIFVERVEDEYFVRIDPEKFGNKMTEGTGPNGK